MFQVEAPDELISLHYGECYRKFLDLTSCTCLGLWRPERGLILPHPCVFTNPSPELQIEPGDQFFVVGKPFTFARLGDIFGGAAPTRDWTEILLNTLYHWVKISLKRFDWWKSGDEQ